MILMALAGVMTAIIFTFGFYFFACYVMWRVGEKFRIGSYGQFLIPVYNIMLLCRCGGISEWVTAGIVFPGFLAAFVSFFSFWFLWAGPGYLASAIFFFCWVYLWGSIAQRLGKNFWLWGILTFLFGGLPVLVLAFDGSMPLTAQNRS